MGIMDAISAYDRAAIPETMPPRRYAIEMDGPVCVEAAVPVGMKGGG